MADQDPATPAEPPKPVHIGGESFVDRVLPHIRKILVGAVLIAVIATGVAAVRWFGERKHVAETEKLDRVLVVAQTPTREPGEKADPKKPGFADAKERAGAVLDAIAKQGTDAAGHAYRGGLLLDVGKVDDAIAEYRRGTADPTIEGVLAREGASNRQNGVVLLESPAVQVMSVRGSVTVTLAVYGTPLVPTRTVPLLHAAAIRISKRRRCFSSNRSRPPLRCEAADATQLA